MVNTVPNSMEALLFTGYILFTILLNILALMISLFYKKKINQPAPRAGFLIAITLSAVFMVMLQIPFRHTLPMQIVSSVILSVSAIASSISIISLFITMSKVRK